MRRFAHVSVFFAGLLFLAMSVLPNSAQARKETDHRYHYEQVWSAAVRLVRVDLRYPIEDQDASIGYVLFQYQSRGQSYPGSIELVRTQVEGVEYVRTVVQIPAMPTYVEQIILDRLDRKLRAEFGAPPERPRRERRRRGRGGDDDDEDEDGDDDDDGQEDGDQADPDGDRRRNGNRSGRRG
ncbi:MAG: hypothetical protein DRJ42_20060 [Deltaproteobacteria bacterium]|nr:MAG: hypothetical protein DRJ42_20060 [Deltaproteobacteria bacterium]